jgi:hypothetical protein
MSTPSAVALRTLLDHPAIALYFSARMRDLTASRQTSGSFEVTVDQLAQGAGVSTVAARASLQALSSACPPPKTAVPGLWFEAVPNGVDAAIERFRVTHIEEAA